jgi:SWIM/SEC-C metal-binding protein
MAKLGTKQKPAVVHVQDMQRAGEIMALCDKRGWQVVAGIEPDKPEDITDIEKLLNPPKPTTTVIIGRNEPCPCGSGKKYKHCCLK